jgi:hypothetical protein
VIETFEKVLELEFPLMCASGVPWHKVRPLNVTECLVLSGPVRRRTRLEKKSHLGARELVWKNNSSCRWRRLTPSDVKSSCRLLSFKRQGD